MLNRFNNFAFNLDVLRPYAQVVFSSVPHTLFWLWLMPLAFSMCVRAVYRSEMREMRMAKIRKKLM